MAGVGQKVPAEWIHLQEHWQEPTWHPRGRGSIFPIRRLRLASKNSQILKSGRKREPRSERSRPISARRTRAQFFLLRQLHAP